MTTQGSSVYATKEIKVGLAVITCLSIALAWVVARRFLRSADAPPAAVNAIQSSMEIAAPPPEARPTILPPSDRYLGPAAYIEPRRLAPIEPIAPEQQAPYGDRPSLLPPLNDHEPNARAAALPNGANAAPFRDAGRIRDAPVGDSTGDDADVGPQPYDEDRSDGFKSSQTSPIEPLSSNLVGRDSDATIVPASTSNASLDGDSPITTSANAQPPTQDAPAALPQRTFDPAKPQILPVNPEQIQPGRKYLVEEGDTLQVIARYELGAAERWPEIYHLNRDQLASPSAAIPPGAWLILPANIARTAERPHRAAPPNR